MEQRSSTDGLSLKERIRSLGFDPEHLTPEEQVELVTLHLSLQGDSSAGSPPVAGDPAPAGESTKRTPRPEVRRDEASRSTRANRPA